MTLENLDEKRKFHRIIYDADATLETANGVLSCTTLDLSLKGCLLEFKEPWESSPDELFTLSIALSEDVEIKMELSVSHVIGNKVGFKCEHIDIESISQLRRLVELNLGDSILLERDLLALSDISLHEGV